MDLSGVVAIAVLCTGLWLAGRSVRGMPTLVGAWLSGSAFRMPPLPHGVQEDDDVRWTWRRHQGDEPAAYRSDAQAPHDLAPPAVRVPAGEPWGAEAAPEIIDLPGTRQPTQELHPVLGRGHHH